MKIVLYTTLALIAFALNSILCRLALRGEEADAAGFTLVRLLSGAVALIVIVYFVPNPKSQQPQVRRFKLGTWDPGHGTFGSWPSAFFLFAYAVCFSFAYLGLTAGTGALILFGSVQMTMIAFAMIRGERPSMLEWLGLAVAVGGLVYLVLPGLQSPPLSSSVLMAAAGLSWAAYTLRGKSSNEPLADTTGNFVRSIPMAAITAIMFFPNLHMTPRGSLLALLSGAVTSGIGYSLWYAALKYHTTTRTALLQLAVPVIAALIGILFLTEPFTTTLSVASLMILGGIGLNIYASRRL